MMNLQTKRLTLRFIQEADWKRLIEIWCDFNHSPYAQYDGPHDLNPEIVKEKVRQWEGISPGKEHMFFAVCLDSRMIGYADFHRTPDGYECGYCFHSDYHGKGYASESLRALFDWIADGKQMRFTAGTAMKNVPSVKLLRSLGFMKIGEEEVSFCKDVDGNDICFTGGIFALNVPARDVHSLLPKDKHDDSTMEKLMALTDAEIEPILPELLTWAQDINWPIAMDVIKVIGKHHKIAEPYILEVLCGTDEVWKYNIIGHLLHEWPSHLGDALIGELARIAGHPTTAEVEAEVEKVACEFMDELAKG